MYASFRQEKFDRFTSFTKAIASNAQSVRVTLAIKKRLAPKLSALLANPRFKEGISYKQDKVIVVEDYLSTHTLDENKALIDKYVRLRLDLWRQGIHDYVFKFKGNHGINASGDVVLIDFNEVCLSKDEAIRSLRSRKWLTLPQYQTWPEGELKDYYTKAMECAMTEEELNRNWMV